MHSGPENANLKQSMFTNVLAIPRVAGIEVLLNRAIIPLAEIRDTKSRESSRPLREGRENLRFELRILSVESMETNH